MLGNSSSVDNFNFLQVYCKSAILICNVSEFIYFHKIIEDVLYNLTKYLLNNLFSSISNLRNRFNTDASESNNNDDNFNFNYEGDDVESATHANEQTQIHTNDFSEGKFFYVKPKNRNNKYDLKNINDLIEPIPIRCIVDDLISTSSINSAERCFDNKRKLIGLNRYRMSFSEENADNEERDDFDEIDYYCYNKEKYNIKTCSKFFVDLGT